MCVYHFTYKRRLFKMVIASSRAKAQATMAAQHPWLDPALLEIAEVLPVTEGQILH